MRTKSPENESKRRNEIIDSCAALYEERGFRDITIKDISERLDISRPAIYKYYETKEEIFLDFVTREAGCWIEDVKEGVAAKEQFSKAEFAELMADTLSKRKMLLKILTMNIYEIEDNSRLERLTAYKNGYKEMNAVLFDAIGKIKPGVSREKRSKVIRLFFPFLNGVYAYSEPTEKQWEAMKEAELDYEATSIHDYVYELMYELLK